MIVVRPVNVKVQGTPLDVRILADLDKIAEVAQKMSMAFYFVAAGLTIYAFHREETEKVIKDFASWLRWDAMPKAREVASRLPLPDGKMWDDVRDAVEKSEQA